VLVVVAILSLGPGCQPEPAPEVATPHEYVDRASLCFGMRCCRPGYGLTGFRPERNELACRAVPDGVQDCFVDYPTVRHGLRACPEGTYARGLARDQNLLTCCFDPRRASMPMAREVLLEPVPADRSASCAANQRSEALVTGFDRSALRLLCGTPSPAVGIPSRPFPTALLDPERPRGFLESSARMSHAAWRSLVRNWLSRMFNLSASGAHLATPLLRVLQTQSVEGGVVRKTLRYAPPASRQTIPAYLFLPPGYHEGGRYRAALILHGHFPDAKEGPASGWDAPAHALALVLAQNGLVTLAPDSRGFGEFAVAGRRSHDDYTVHMQVSTTGHRGQLMPLLTRDNLASLTVLLSTPGVTSAAVGGLSLGGVQAMWLSALDERVSSVFLVGSFFGLACLNDPELAHSCQTVPGVSADRHDPAASLLIDAPDLAALIAPRPLLVMWGTEDHLYGLTPRTSTRPCSETALQGARAVYRAIGASAALAVQNVPWAEHEIDTTGVVTFLTGRRPADALDWGSTCHGLRCCPPGEAVAGIHPARDLLLCRRAGEKSGTCEVIDGSSRQGTRACPEDSYLRGFDRRSDRLVCCARPRSNAGERLDPSGDGPATQVQGLHGCPSGFPLAVGISGTSTLLCRP
jgi:hypothetical protein